MPIRVIILMEEHKGVLTASLRGECAEPFSEREFAAGKQIEQALIPIIDKLCASTHNVNVPCPSSLEEYHSKNN